MYKRKNTKYFDYRAKHKVVFIRYLINFIEITKKNGHFYINNFVIQQNLATFVAKYMTYRNESKGLYSPLQFSILLPSAR